MTVRTVLFWDIDGTLLSTGRAGIFAWEDAVRDVLGVPCGLQELHTAGMTDPQIAARLVELYGNGGDASVANAVLRRYEAALPGRLPMRQGRVMPGVRELLDAAGERGDVLSLLLTGNTRAGAAAKLGYYGLDGYFGDGAFSDDFPDRTSVARRGCSLAQELLSDACPAVERMFVIGDTPDDIACGKAIGARTIAVATGVYTREQLSAHQPWLVLDELPLPDDFFKLLGHADESA